MDRRGGRRVGPALVWCAVACCAGLSGCANFWDDLTAHEPWNEKWHRLTTKDPDPLVVLQDEKCKDGTMRARAFRRLIEPQQHGGSQADQDLYIQILVQAAATEATAPARMAAIEVLGRTADPRAVKGLEDAYYHAAGFMQPDVATVLRCQALAALGATRQPAAVDLLTKVLKAPPVDKNTTEADRQRDIDERYAAVHALGHFRQEQATTALVAVLRNERDQALRGEARVALVEITGANLPEDANKWDEYLHNPNASEHYANGNLFQKILPASFRSP